MTKNSLSRAKGLLILHSGILIYSFSAVFIKQAAAKEFFSFGFFLFYALSLASLFCYALLWQQALRRFSLSFAYIHRAAGMLWSVLFGALLFYETITLKHALGVLLIIMGIGLAVSGDE